MTKKPLVVVLNEPDIFSSVDLSDRSIFSSVLLSGKDSIDHAKVDVLCVGLRDVIDDEFLKKYVNLRFIVSPTTGVDHIKTKRNIKVIHLNPQDILEVSATAEFTLAIMLSLVRKIPFIDPNRIADRQAYRGHQLKGKLLGIFGFGRIGKMLARYADALEMKWQAFDLDSSSQVKADILAKSDIISIHLPLKPENVSFISDQEFSQMKRKPYLINSARPQLIDKQALIRALKQDQISGLAMDFINYDASNNWDPDLKKYAGDKLLLTPHIGGNTYESIAYTSNIVVKKLIVELTKSNLDY